MTYSTKNKHLPRSRNTGKRQPPGSKIGRKLIEAAGQTWNGQRYDTSSLTELNQARAAQRLANKSS